MMTVTNRCGLALDTSLVSLVSEEKDEEDGGYTPPHNPCRDEYPAHPFDVRGAAARCRSTHGATPIRTGGTTLLAVLPRVAGG